MPPNTTRRPSTLAASKAIAAQMPLGMRPKPAAVPDPRAPKGKVSALPPTAARGAVGNASREWDRGGSAASARDPRSARATSGTGPATLAVKSATATGGSNRLLIGALTLLVGIAVAAGGAKATTAMAENKAVSSIEGLLTIVSQHQVSFRIELQRYATWEELEERGMRLPSRQQVVRSSADASHWFMRVRDRNTGVECDRIGELVTDPTVETKSTCHTREGDL